MMTKVKMSFHETIIIILSVRLGSDESTSSSCPVKYIMLLIYLQILPVVMSAKGQILGILVLVSVKSIEIIIIHKIFKGQRF